MLSWIVRALLLLSSTITGWFVAQDSSKFDIIQMVVVIFLVTMTLIIIAFGYSLFDWFKNILIKSSHKIHKDKLLRPK
ncbi:hypothetical protein [Legionella fallonii]|uniref:Uncharacterized protein n=1 Tax=Legionella fallonii LLAP-10 TaxID=1212491 RepID=A0A098G968_9GAMM|nr:hypothetical protein [Legionella fallonii]CEG58549.1 conserved protein of unknown function [Legionella fallonii LLAP-10]